ncbi:MAG: hypothetical protein IJL03_06910 [Lachnospiraceae bacterium]|nr:hypothetical protein [Lachnospiraceae bacterium]
MKKSLVTRTALLLAIISIVLFGSVCVASAADDSNKGNSTTNVDYLNEKDDSGLLDAQTNTVKKVGRSVVKFLLIVLDTVGVIAIIVLAISLAFGLGDPTNRQKMKNGLIILVVALVLGNCAVFLVNWLIGIAQNMQ